uniref:NADH-ubiquinone oxidoreductase chain 1 n=1 Tax=Paralongidorus litoralis TaxID=474435 RepID=A0A1P8C763_9BILA|nr:NADH dehydrogenase subunit 1 [Paralongidorus litoralis]AOT84241.1 NADH dehydrogenase subunit 1 [Paralongidorus litoralis]
MTMWVIELLLIILLGMGVVAFITLLERKMLGLSQLRLGPNKVTLVGVLQPVMDGVKLLLKELHLMQYMVNLVMLISTVTLLFLFMIFWGIVLPWGTTGLMLNHYSALLFFSVLGAGTYAIMLVGWSSTSPFSKLGSLRGMLQSLSFEVALVMVFFIPLVIFDSLAVKNDQVLGAEVSPWAVIWLLICLMESNRAPFDLLEGESELISGFNIETSSFPFVFVFLSEYGMLASLGMVTSVGLLGGMNMVALLALMTLLFVRSCYPRVRYDVMMSLMWHSILPSSLIFFFVLMTNKLENSVKAFLASD